MLYSVLLLLLGVASHVITACSCARGLTLCDQLDDKSALFMVNATTVSIGRTRAGETFMSIRVIRSIKGNLRVNGRYRVKTGQGSLCQLSPFPLRTPVILTLFSNPGSAIPLSGSICNFNKVASSLTIEEGTILFNYPALCRNICPPGVPTLPCKQNPCDSAACPAFPNAECRPDYCGGCRARFYTAGNEVTTSCELPATPPCPTYNPDEPMMICDDPCMFAKCPAHPEAQCRAGGCGGCTALFYSNGKEVTCVLPPTPPPTPPCPTDEPRIVCDDPCRLAKCPAHPEAKCQPGGCSGCNAHFYAYGQRVYC